MLRSIAYPLYDVPAISGDAAAVADAAVAESESLSDHESQFAPGASDRSSSSVPDLSEDEPAADRDASGRFRHRAKSQRADADDVPLIAEQTKRLRELEDKHGADIARKPGESDRVYNLRRRADLLERLSQAPKEPPASPAAAPTPTAPPVAARRAEIPATFPEYEAWVGIQGNEDRTYNEYLDTRADWRYAMARAAEQQTESVAQQQQAVQQQFERYQAGLAKAKTTYADWDTVVTADAEIEPTLMAAILSATDPHAVAYYLGKNPELRIRLNLTHPGYVEAAVPTLRKHLDALVATQRPPVPPTPTAAASTGSAPVAKPSTPPRPPNPVRTGTIAAADTPPDDDSSLSAHEKAFGKRLKH